MCGLNGIFLKDPERRVAQTDVLRMRDSMVHRGPDEEGIHLDRNIGLGHRRLSIIGLTTGQQPMSDAGGKLWIVYNGETYNYKALRELLQGRGYAFRTESDTEVVLNLFAEFGPDCVKRMNGLFAFAIWDSEKRELFVARDRLGIKPLYFVDGPDAFVFASEIKAILQSGCVETAINDAAVYEYFMFRAVAGDRTLFRNVQCLLPGHRMTVTPAETRIDRYWDETCGDVTPVTGMEEAAERLDELLTDAVNIRLMSEVPLGTFCSGGVDSSLVTALAAKARGSSINTFSVGFDEDGFDESDYARLVSERYGTTHHEIRISGQEFAELVPQLVFLNDEPLNFANSVHIFAVSKLAKKYVTVVLTGEGADELFLGYPRYHLPGIAGNLDAMSWLASPLLSVAAGIMKDHRFAKLRAYLAVPRTERILINAAVNEPDGIADILEERVPADLGFRRAIAEKLSSMDDLLRQLSINDQKTYLVSILNRQDKMSMAASVEARVPFIDYRIAEFANRIDSGWKTRGWRTKELVKHVASRYLPDEVVHRRKSGFGVPLARYFRQKPGLGGDVERLIHDSDCEAWLNRSVLARKFEEHQAGSSDHTELLWTTMNFLTWKEQYGL